MRLKLILCALMSCCASLAAAQQQAVSITIGTSGVIGGTDAGLFAWEFQPTTNIAATHLGIFDHPLLGSPGLAQDDPVAIWKSADPTTPIVSTTVPAELATPVLDNFRYVPVSPTLLLAGTKYVIATYFASADGDGEVDASDNAVSVSINPLITFVSRRYYVGGPPHSGLVFPLLASSGTGTFGPSFRFVVVPEPSTLSATAIGWLCLALYRARR